MRRLQRNMAPAAPSIFSVANARPARAACLRRGLARFSRHSSKGNQMRALLPIVLAGTLLAGCDQKEGANVTVKDKNGDVTISANGQHFTMKANDGSHSEVTISGSGGHFTMHAGDGKSVVDINASGGVDVGGKLPGFVSVYPGAKVI